MSQHLTRRQFQTLTEFARLQREDGIAPTLEQLGSALGLNRVTVYGHVQALIEKGLLENLLPGASRGLELTEAGLASLPAVSTSIPVAPGRSGQQGAAGVTSVQSKQAPPPEPRDMPLLGKIAAGGPIDVLESPQSVQLPDYLRVQDHHYLLEVAGDSMQNAGIHPGDLVMIDRQAEVQRNDIVVAVLQGASREECTLKRWLPLDRERVLLLPENPRYQPLEVANSELELRGVVRGVIRRL